MSEHYKTSVAVLPFKNRSADETNEYFCDGLTEEIIHALSTIEELRVISRNSVFHFKQETATTEEIGSKLNVNTLVEGSVRFSGDSLRVSAQLVEVSTDQPFWSETWDRKKADLFEIQDEVSLAIAEKLREELGHLNIDDHLSEKLTENLEAYDYYLQGKYHANRWNARDVNQAITEYKKVIDLDPNMIQGYLGLADAYSFLAVAAFAPREETMAKSMEAIEAAKRIDSSNAQLNSILGNTYFFGHASYAMALEYFLKSLASDPSNSETHRFLSFIYSLSGDEIKSRDHIFYAKSVDPLNPETRFFEANYYYRFGEYDKASGIIDSLLAENPNNLPAVYLSVYLKLKTGKVKDAQVQLRETPEELFTPDERLGIQALIEIFEGRKESPYFEKLLDRRNDITAHHAHSYLYMCYVNKGDFKKAFEMLDFLFDHQSSVLLISFSDPLCDDIKSVEKYQELHARVYPSTVSVKAQSKKSTSTLPEEETEKYLSLLNEFVDQESPFLNPGLSLRLLAESIELHPNTLSRLLNDKIGKNFNEFVNGLRIEHFKEAVLDPKNSHISLIGLAYESGFNSKTVFNTAFKKAEGMTPKEYQKSQQSKKEF